MSSMGEVAFALRIVIMKKGWGGVTLEIPRVWQHLGKCTGSRCQNSCLDFPPLADWRLGMNSDKPP